MQDTPQRLHELNDPVASLAYANPVLPTTGTIRRQAADFVVHEQLSFEPSGEGEHLFLLVEKTGCNTDWVARQLQSQLQLRSQDVGYAGKKDRHSVSQQWFSLHLPGRDISVDDLNNESFRIVRFSRHNKKLRMGAIKRNDFQLIIRDMNGFLDENRLAQLKTDGFPNYFGYQRFGHQGKNLTKADGMLTGKFKVRSRNQRGLFISAIRSHLFNLILASRVKAKNWNRLVVGDCVSLDGKRSYFHVSDIDEEIQERLTQADIHVSGWMAGRQASEATALAAEYETCVLNAFDSWLSGLDKARIDSARRPYRVIPEQLDYRQVDSDTVEIKFSLPSGSYATSLLRELVHVRDAKREFSKDD